MPNLVKSAPANLRLIRPKIDYSAVGLLLEELRVGRNDDVKLRIRNGVVTVHAKRPSGRVDSATIMLGGQFQQSTKFDPSGLSPKARQKVVKKLRKDGLRQTAIADLIGVSQATVSLDLRK
jgi:DNA-binding NarL/FixJ family response regulator